MLKKKNPNTIKKFSYIITFSLLITFLLIKTSSKIEYDLIKKTKTQTPRKLEVTNEKIEQLCKDGTKEVYDYFYKSSNDIKEEKYNDKENYIQSLISLIDGNGDKNQAIKDYVKHILPFLFFFAVGILSIVGWIVCIFCCLCKCCCCCCCKNSCCKGFAFILSMGLYAVTVICAIYGLSIAKSLFKGFNATSCSLMRFVYNVIDGQSVEKIPKWIGVSGVQNILKQTKDEINNNLQESTTDFQTNANSLDTSFNNWKTTTLPNAYTSVNNQKIDWQGYGNEYQEKTSSPYYKLVPSYVTTYGPYTDSGTTLYGVHQEFTAIKEVIDNANANIQDTIANAEFTSSLEDASVQIQDLQDQFDKLSNDIIDPWYNYQEKVNTLGNKVFYAVFTLMAALVTGLAALVFLFTFNKCKMLGCALKLLIHILWNISAILMILSFILGSIFGIIGLFGKDLVSVLHFVMSKDNLNSNEPKLINSGNSKKYIDICINGDGNLIDELIGDDGNKLDDLIQIRNDVINYENQLKQYETSKVIKLFEDNFNKWENQYLSVPFQIDGQIFKVDKIFSEVNTFLKSDNQVSGTPSPCIKIDDVWGTIDNSNGFTKASPSDTSPTAFSKHSINIYDTWTVTNFQNRYSQVCDIQSTISPTSNVHPKDEAPKYYGSFVAIKDGVTNILTNIKTFDNTLNDKYKNINLQMRNTLKECNNVITPIYNIFNELLGPNGGLKTMLNCTFINYDLKIVLKQLYNGLGKNFYNVGVIMVLSSTCLAFGICFTLLTINIIKSDEKDSSPSNSNNKKRQSIDMNNKSDFDSRRVFVANKY